MYDSYESEEGEDVELISAENEEEFNFLHNHEGKNISTDMKVNKGDDLFQQYFSSLVIGEGALLPYDPLDLELAKQLFDQKDLVIPESNKVYDIFD